MTAGSPVAGEAQSPEAMSPEAAIPQLQLQRVRIGGRGTVDKTPAETWDTALGQPAAAHWQQVRPAPLQRLRARRVSTGVQLSRARARPHG